MKNFSFYSLILTFHFKPGSYFCQLNVLVVRFLVCVMPIIKKKKRRDFSTIWINITFKVCMCFKAFQTLTWKWWSPLGWRMWLHAYCPLLELEKDTWGYSIPVWAQLISCMQKQVGMHVYSARSSPHLLSCQVARWSCEKLGEGRPQKWCLCLEHHASWQRCKVWNKLWVQTAGGILPNHLWIYMKKKKNQTLPSAVSLNSL